MVFSKVGVSVLSAIASISALASFIKISKAGKKCSFLTFEKGAKSKGIKRGCFMKYKNTNFYC
jgi:hypothetical protein